ncbi:YhcN/YlaJ family sporulation lipoprotein [Evansella tamaricis]|uniref:YhcN/YlaJ family sporulation lipoprotein n=1 Tax=Evansella tamaricis TaxID=2069301 RepID=A0ABS6JBD3_9BACI|nr:YhcN/YlaJ family sporulation lipoprotein [Evansella tamaricis]MBU9710152.1 YhcN/YlaJ family sporulation lipoprotein [Evansella tamaricis]
MMLLRKSAIYLFLIITLVLTGCNNHQGELRALEMESHNPVISQELAEKMARKVSFMDEVDHVHSVSLDKDVFMTLRVSGFDRLFLERIRKEAFNKAKSIDQDSTVHVSTDRKIDMDLAKIKKRVYERTISEKELEKKLKKLENDMKG